MEVTWIRFLGQEDRWKRAWQSTLVFLPEEPHGQRSLVGYSPLSHKASDATGQAIMRPDPEHSPALTTPPANILRICLLRAKHPLIYCLITPNLSSHFL